MRLKQKTISLALYATLLASLVSATELRLHRFFTDNMVLQRDKPVLIKGWADAGDEVTLSFAGQKKIVKADDQGAWSITLEAMAANKSGQELSVMSADSSVSLNQVLVGDVLIFARQSTIDLSLGRNDEGRKAAAEFTANPLLRVMQITTIPCKDPQDDLGKDATSGWMQVDKKSALSLSAAAFYLGRDLINKIDLPLGIVDLRMGSHFAAGWMSSDGLQKSLTIYPDQGDLPYFIKTLPPLADAWAKGETHKQRDEYYAERLADAKKRGNPPPRKPALGLAPLDYPYYPSAGYNAVIYPLRGIATKGILLQLGNDYQLVTYANLRAKGKITDRAELDRAWPQSYSIIKHANRMTPTTLPLVPTDWRRAFGDKTLPIGMIMPPGSDFFDYAIHNREIRELHRRTQKKTSDLGLIMPGSEHIPLSGQPKDDKLLAERCRHWVLGALYNKKEFTPSGPVFERVETGLGKATIHFKKGTAKGLADRGGALELFEVAGTDKEFHPCTASIDGTTIKLKSAQYIQFIRYNWRNKPEQGLVNSAELPAIPFTTLADWEYEWWPPTPPVELPLEYTTPASQWPQRDVAIINGAIKDTKSGDSERFPRWLGPTGIFSDPFGPNIYVHRTEAGTPAHGKVLPGDLIFGVNGDEFGDDTYRQLSAAITLAESDAGKGRMVLGIRRKGQNIEVELKLDVLGSYSSTTPYYCPKSEKIVERAETWIANRFRPAFGPVNNASGFLDSDLYFLMASGNPEHQGLVRRVIYSKIASMQPLKPADPNQSAHVWNIGYSSMLLGEYYHMTGDRNVLPYLKNLTERAAMSQIKEAGPKAVTWEVAQTVEQVGGWRQRYNPKGADRWKSGYGLMPHAGMACVMGMLLADEAGLDIDKGAMKRGLIHFNKCRAEYGDVIYWYHPLRRVGPKPIKPEAEAAGLLSSMNGKLGTAAALFSMVNYNATTEICSRSCVYSFNNTRNGHGGMFFNNFWTPIGAHASGEDGYKHFMKGQNWWRELYRRDDGSFTQSGRGGIGVAYALHRVAHRKRLRMLGATRSAFGPNPPAYLAPALAAHSKRDYALAEQLVRSEMKERIIPAEEQPMVDHLLQAVQMLKESIEHDLNYTEQLIKEDKYYYATVEMQQLKGVVAADNPRLQAIQRTLSSPQSKTKMKIPLGKSDTTQEQRVAKATKEDSEKAWSCLMTEVGSDRNSPLGKVPEEEASRWHMKVFEKREHAPEGWTTSNFDDKNWDEATLPISWRVSHAALLRGKLIVEDRESFDALRFRGMFMRQQNIEIYLNGELVAQINNSSGSLITHELTEYALTLLRNGENTIAIVTTHAKRWGKVKGNYSRIFNSGGFGFRLDARMKK